MTDTKTGASEPVDTEPRLDCFPIFQQFSRETLIEMVAQKWKPLSDVSNVSPRANVVVKLENTGEAQEQVCPIAFCLWKEGKAWTEYEEDGEWMSAFTGSPDENAIALELIGVPFKDYAEDDIDAVVLGSEKFAKFDELRVQARDFIKLWDAGKITDLAAAACLTQSE